MDTEDTNEGISENFTSLEDDNNATVSTSTETDSLGEKGEATKNGPYKQVSAGDYHACAIRQEDGSLDCWGVYPPDYWRGLPQAVDLPPEGSFKQVDSDYDTTCALREDGKLICWGARDYWPCGVQGGNEICKNSEILSGPFKQIDARSQCALKEDGTILCWGYYPDNYQDPPTKFNLDVYQIAGDFTEFVVGENGIACALTKDGATFCIVADEAAGEISLPVPSARFSQIGIGENYFCGLEKETGKVICWSEERYPYFSMKIPATGYPNVTADCVLQPEVTGEAYNCDASQPVEYCQLPTGYYIQFARNYNQFCGLKKDGTVHCCDPNLNPDAQKGPDVTLNENLTQIIEGTNHFCGFREDKTVFCWGGEKYNGGQAPDDIFTQIALGISHSCGTTKDGAIKCWGSNYYGQIDAPTGTFISLSTNDDENCAIDDTHRQDLYLPMISYSYGTCAQRACKMHWKPSTQ